MHKIKPTEQHETCFVMCPVWNLFVPKDGLKIEDGVLFQGLNVGKLDEFDRRTCDSFVSCVLPISIDNYNDESDFIEAANEITDEFMITLLTRLRLYTRAYVINGQWQWFLKQGDGHDVMPSETRSKDKIYGGTYYFSELDEQKYHDFLPTFEEIKEISESIAITRYNSSFARGTLADELIDLMVMMESLFNDSPGDSTYKIVIRSSFLISKKLKVEADKLRYREYTYEWVQKAYSIRSKILHGAKKPNDEDIAEVLFKLKYIFIDVLLDSFELKRTNKFNLFGKKDYGDGEIIDYHLMHSN